MSLKGLSAETWKAWFSTSSSGSNWPCPCRNAPKSAGIRPNASSRSTSDRNSRMFPGQL